MLFTPRHAATNLRLHMNISDKDADRVNGFGRGEGYHGIATDIATGQRWHVFGANCGIPGCKCDAVVYEVRD